MDKLLTKDVIVNKLKQLKSNKKERDVANDDKLKDALIDLKNKMPSTPRIILLAGFNEAARPELIKDNLAQLLGNFKEESIEVNTKSATLEGNTPYELQSFRITTNNKISPELKTENYILLTSPRIPETFLDYCKVADIVCVVLSCKDVDKSSVAFDDKGHAMLNVMRAQGSPAVVGVLQDLETIDTSKQAAVKETFQKLLSVDEKVVAIDEKDALMKVLQEVSLKQLEWREIRSYFLSEKLQVDPQSQLVEMEGFLKGSYFNPNQLVHITGYGDYPVLQVDILHNPFMSHEKRQKLVEDFTNSGFSPDENILASFFAEESKMEDFDQFLNENTHANEFGFREEEVQQQEEAPAYFEEDQIEDEDSDISFEEDNTDLSATAILEEKKKLRGDDDEELLDEVNFPPDVKAFQRFMKYRGLKNFKTSPWDPFSDLPDEYENIFTFADFNKSKKLAIEKTQKEAVAYNGFYVKIYVAGFPIDKLSNRDFEKPIVVSSLLSHERKISVLNLKVKSADVINSKETVEIHLGFRILTTQPIFSQLINGVTKTKYEKKTQKDQFYMASFYGEVTYPPANAVVFRTNGKGMKDLVASGELMKPDPFKVIIKRVILTGYPVKTYKRLAIIKMMLFNDIDVSWFKPVKLFTKHSLKGFIKESVGKNGCMKCVFNSRIHKNDTVCLDLYKRVFPKWHIV